ncbi:MAG TPA: pitrilysin family protein [Vicinamibacterales bacterium]|nr:pitrilysin family protein [Vicinamibacterales bacterium]
MPADRASLPRLGPEPHFTFPEIRRGRLANGIDVWTAEHHDVPLVSALVLVRAGASFDPAVRPGLAAITGDLLDEGCGDLDALALHDRLGRLGAQLETEVGADATLVGLTTLERFAAPSLALLAEMITAPRLDERDFERVRDLRVNRLLQLREMPPAVAERVFARLLFGNHPYGHLPIGTEESLRAMDAGEPRTFHREMYDPSRVTIIAVGDASHDALLSLVDGAFGAWKGSATAHSYPDPAALPVPALDSTNGNRLYVVGRAQAPQSELRIGHVAVSRTSPDYHALVTMNLVLGGQFVSRINSNLRERKGYTYGARTSFDFRRGPGPFVLYASVQSEATADAVSEAMNELRAIRHDRPVTPEELELGRAALTRGYPRNFETAEQIGRALAQLALYGLPDDYFTEFVPKVMLLTTDDLTRAAAQHINPDRLLAVIVGDPEKIGGGLTEIGLGEPVILPANS